MIQRCHLTTVMIHTDFTIFLPLIIVGINICKMFVTIHTFRHCITITPFYFIYLFYGFLPFYLFWALMFAASSSKKCLQWEKFPEKIHTHPTEGKKFHPTLPPRFSGPLHPLLMMPSGSLPPLTLDCSMLHSINCFDSLYFLLLSLILHNKLVMTVPIKVNLEYRR